MALQPQQVQAQQRFRGPVPGQAMTAGEKSRPWFNPAKYNTVEDAMEFYLETLSSEQQSIKLLSVIKKGIPLTSLSETITTGGVMEGLHTIDVALLLNPILVEFMKGLSELAKVKYTLDGSIPEEQQVDMSTVKSAIEEELSSKEPMVEAIGQEIRKDKMGLMSRVKEEK
jgi:hypothetical protein|tara:strand:- start:2777 stop:3286 length:510 start_codon:yes stop_codon:yes gene_type:complete